MPSHRLDTIVMTEFAPFFFHHFPALASHPSIRIRRIYFSQASAARLEAFLSSSPASKTAFVLSALRRRQVRRAISSLMLLLHSDRVMLFNRWTFTAEPADYLCSLGFLRRIPREQIEMSRTSSNIHWSLLPRYAGCHPWYWAIRNGETCTGVTIHQISPEYDAGSIMLQRRVPIRTQDTADDLLPRLARVSTAAFRAYLRRKRILDGMARPQDHSRYEFHRAPCAQDFRLESAGSAAEIRARLRAAGSTPCYVNVLGREHRVLALAEDSERIPVGAARIDLRGVPLLAKAA